MKSLVILAGLGIGTILLSLQLYLTFTSRLAAGETAIGALVFYFSFFTILTNLSLVLIYASDVMPAASALSWFRKPSTRVMMAGLMLLVMVFYHLLLAGTWKPQGWFKVCDIGLHYVTPILYLTWWSWGQTHGGVRFSDVPSMIIPPLIYVIYVMIRGAIAGLYPYAVFDAGHLGYGAVIVNILVLLAIMIIIWSGFVTLDKRLTKTPQA